MVIRVERFSAHTWQGFSEKSHLVVFGELRDFRLERIDFAIVAFGNNQLGGYMTCKEMDAETVYIQYGGVYPSFANSVHVVSGYKKMLEDLLSTHKQLTTRIENVNVRMLKMAMALGFRITGVSVFKEKTFVELLLAGT